MRPPSLPHFSYPTRLPGRGTHIVAAFTLVLALLAGLACDENVPTESRASSKPTGTAVDLAEGDLPVLADVTAAAIALPVNQSVSTVAPNPAFRVNQTGTGPNGIFQISRAANQQNALQGLTNGRGRAGLFQITNGLNPLPALEVDAAGSGFALQALATGSGSAGEFRIANTTNVRTALTGVTAGTGSAGLFEVSNLTNSQPALEVSTSGTGAAGSFRSFNENSPSVALVAASSSVGGSFSASQIGAGRGGLIQITEASNPSTALLVKTRGTGLALDVQGRTLFEGNVQVNGTLTKWAGSFRIDHPLDPEHKYLSHSFVESPDMMDVYNGNVTLDADGQASVELPDYFEALNRDFRYQLTAIGAPGPNLYIAEGVQQNHFRIAGGRPYAHVSWQVTGVRQDAYANEHRIKVEEEKPGSARQFVAHR